MMVPRISDGTLGTYIRTGITLHLCEVGSTQKLDECDHMVPCALGHACAKESFCRYESDR